MAIERTAADVARFKKDMARIQARRVASISVGIVDELTYRSYRHNRLTTPDTTPDQWRVIFGASVDAMEARHQQETRNEDHHHEQNRQVAPADEYHT